MRKKDQKNGKWKRKKKKLNLKNFLEEIFYVFVSMDSNPQFPYMSYTIDLI